MAEFDEESMQKKSMANLVITEFAQIAHAGCEQDKDQEGLKPSIVKAIYKTWNRKAFLFHENTMMGTIINDILETFFANSDPAVNGLPSVVVDIKKHMKDLSQRTGAPYLFLLKLQMEKILRHNAFCRENPHLINSFHDWVLRNPVFQCRNLFAEQ